MCVSSDLDSVKEQAIWLDETQKYKLPDLVVHRTKLPPAGMYSGSILGPQ